MITDWIQAIAVLFGVPLTIWSIYNLFRKDKDQEQKLQSLKSIAENQAKVISKLAEQVEQLSIHSSHFQYQSSLMLDANKLMERQIDLQNKIYLQDKDIENGKLEIDRRKRISDIMPYFILHAAHSTPEMFNLNIENKGGDAKNVKIIELGSDFAWFQKLPNNSRIDRNGTFDIKGGPKSDNTYYNGNNVSFDLILEFEDIDGNKYDQNIKRFQTGSYKIDEPKIR